MFVKGGNLFKEKGNMCKKSVAEYLEGNIIQRFEELYDVKKKVLKGIKMKPHHFIEVVFGDDFFAPRVKEDGVTIEVHADYVSFLWGLIYGSWILCEEVVMKTGLIRQGKPLSQDVDLIKRARRVLDITLKNRAYSCPICLPNPQKGKNVNEQFYIQKVNGINNPTEITFKILNKKLNQNNLIPLSSKKLSPGLNSSSSKCKLEITQLAFLAGTHHP